MNWFAPHEYQNDGFFQCKSVFEPYVEPQEFIDPEPYEEKIKQSKKQQYLPGEKLLLELDKKRKKENTNHKKKNNLDIDRISESLSRTLREFGSR